MVLQLLQHLLPTGPRAHGGGHTWCCNFCILSLRHRPGWGTYKVFQLSQPLVVSRPRMGGHTWCRNCHSLSQPLLVIQARVGNIHCAATVAGCSCDTAQGGGTSCTSCRNCCSLPQPLLATQARVGDIHGVATVAASCCDTSQGGGTYTV